MNTATLDFETHYTPTYSLSKMTTQEYIADPRFEVIGLGIRWPDDKRATWHTGAAAERQLSHLATYQGSVLAVGHNMLFDASILGHRYNIHPAGLACTMGMANVLGLGLSVGGSLAALTEVFRAAGYPLEPKGNEVVAALGKRLADFSPSELAAYGRYCCTDTDNCATFFGGLRELIPDEEMLWQSQVLRMHTKPRLRIDAAVVAAELERVKARRAEAIERMRQRLGLPTFSDEELRTLAASRTKLVELLEMFGVVVPTKISSTTGKHTPALSKKDTEFLALLEHPDEMVRALVEARLEMASNIEQSRCLQMLRLAKLPRFAAPLKISGAHTHRLGGDDGIGLLNFPSGRKPGQSDALKRSIVPLDPDEVFVGADSSQVEVRVLDYCADDWKGLENFRNGICPYSDMATRMWPTDGVDAAVVKKLAKADDETWASRRQIAKAVVLACFDADTKVLTLRGPVRIVDVVSTDLVWDGEEWVECGGVAARGVRAVTEFAGTLVTPDHRVLGPGGWVEVQHAFELDVVNFGERHLPHHLQDERGRLHRAGQQSRPSADRAPGASAIRDAQESEDAGDVEQARRGQLHLCGGHPMREGQDPAVRAGAGGVGGVPPGRIHDDEHPRAGPLALARDEQTWYGGELPRSGASAGSGGRMVGVAEIARGRRHHEGRLEAEHGQDESQPGVRGAAQGSGGCCTGNTGASCPTGCAAEGTVGFGGAGKADRAGGEPHRCDRHDLRPHMDKPLGGGNGDRGPHLDAEHRTGGEAEDAQGVQLRPVFDLVNCGPRNRFMVIGSDGQAFIAHNCGFGQGGPGFRDYAETQAGLVFTVEEATAYVYQYREAKPRVVAFWRRCDRVLQAMIQGEQGYFGGPDGKLFFFDGSRTVIGRHIPGIRLPNGTWLNYPNLRNTKVKEVDEETGEVRWREVVCYSNAKGRTTETVFTWGGTLTENLVQALAFAVMKWQAGGDTITQHGLVLNCHDAHAVLVPRLQAAEVKTRLLTDMSECPPWVPGLPLGAEADVAETMAGVI